MRYVENTVYSALSYVYFRNFIIISYFYLIVKDRVIDLLKNLLFGTGKEEKSQNYSAHLQKKDNKSFK